MSPFLYICLSLSLYIYTHIFSLSFSHTCLVKLCLCSVWWIKNFYSSSGTSEIPFPCLHDTINLPLFGTTNSFPPLHFSTHQFLHSFILFPSSSQRSHLLSISPSQKQSTLFPTPLFSPLLSPYYNQVVIFISKSYNPFHDCNDLPRISLILRVSYLGDKNKHYT